MAAKKCDLWRHNFYHVCRIHGRWQLQIFASIGEAVPEKTLFNIFPSIQYGFQTLCRTSKGGENFLFSRKRRSYMWNFTSICSAVSEKKTFKVINFQSNMAAVPCARLKHIFKFSIEWGSGLCLLSFVLIRQDAFFNPSWPPNLVTS